MKTRKTTLVALTIFALLFGCGNPSRNDQESDDAKESQADHQHAPEVEDGKGKPLSPRIASMENIGQNHIHIDYGSPGKRGRMIFGGLVGYGSVWATGAHKATWIDFDKDVLINEVEIPAGKYGLFTIPGESEWIIIINKDWDMHLADDYNETNDIVRITSTAQSLDEIVESLTFEVTEIEDKKGRITIKWDQTAVSFELENK